MSVEKIKQFSRKLHLVVVGCVSPAQKQRLLIQLIARVLFGVRIYLSSKLCTEQNDVAIVTVSGEIF